MELMDDFYFRGLLHYFFMMITKKDLKCMDEIFCVNHWRKIVKE